MTDSSDEKEGTDFICPQCKNEGENDDFAVAHYEASSCTGYSTGTEVHDTKHHEYYSTGFWPGGFCRCTGCGYEGAVEEFATEKGMKKVVHPIIENLDDLLSITDMREGLKDQIRKFKKKVLRHYELQRTKKQSKGIRP